MVKLSKNLKNKKALVNIATFILALVFHMLMEGFLFGVQTTTLSLGSLFFGIIVHKCLVMFSVGIKLARQLQDRLKLAIALIVMLAFASPVSGLIGLLIKVGFLYCIFSNNF
jgi:zinc transporter 1/2/3